MNLKPHLKLTRYVVLGALVFWVPDILVHALTRDHFSGIEALFLTFFLPILTCFVLARTWRAKGTPSNFLFVGFMAVLGIWLFGPLMTMAGASFSGGGFVKSEGWQAVWFGIIAFPLSTIMMSTYDGTLFAVFLVTAALPLMSLFLKHKPHPADVTYREAFPSGTEVRIADRRFLEEFAASWKFHNKLQPEQFAYAGRVAKVQEVGFYHGGDPIYKLEQIPGIWLEPCLRSNE